MLKLEYSQFGRQSCRHEILPLQGPGGSGWGACFDDAYAMNPREWCVSFYVGVLKGVGRWRCCFGGLVMGFILVF
jgi:hypothetical protein